MCRLYLVGMMGTGKTTIGKELANHLNLDFCDLDEYIENSVGRKISDIFMCEGEPFFRDLETNSLLKLSTLNSNNNGIVIATGGGAFEREQNRSIMLNSGSVIWLLTSPKEIANRLANDTSRPLLEDASTEELEERITALLEKRQVNYQLANIHIDTEGKTLNEIVEEIAGAIIS